MSKEQIHSIRLHGPWQASILEVFDQSIDLTKIPDQHRLKFPFTWDDWLGNSFAGRVLLTRPFRMPSGLESEQSVFIVIDQAFDNGVVSLNEECIGIVDCNTAFRVEVSKMLRSQNYLKIEIERQSVEVPPLVDAANGSVRLEIIE